jgi:hypothetical protein
MTNWKSTGIATLARPGSAGLAQASRRIKRNKWQAASVILKEHQAVTFYPGTRY